MTKSSRMPVIGSVCFFLYVTRAYGFPWKVLELHSTCRYKICHQERRHCSSRSSTRWN